MRKLLILLLLAGCDSSGSDEQASSGQAANAPGAPVPAAAQNPAAELESRARSALEPIVADPKSIRFAELKAGSPGSICGRIETKQPDGKPAVRPFVVTPEGVAVISTAAQVNLTDPEDPFPDFYIRWCASPAELARLQPQMVGGETLGLGATPPPDIPDVPPDLPGEKVPPPPPPAAERPAAQAKAEPPPRPPVPTNEDSFFNVVARPGGKE
jgi:hypothetical protein